MPITNIKNIRIFPPLAIARLGSSPEPMDNYDLLAADDITGYRKLVPAASFQVTNNTISDVQTPSSVQFRDNNNRIKPVSPFLEIWAILETDGVEADEFEQLTKDHLSELGLSDSDLRWQVNVGNLKAFRRTGDNNDKVIADTGSFNNHQAQALTGECPNFKTGKSIPFGNVQYIEPNDNFPQIRLRFIPAIGAVFGPDANDPNTSDDVYDRNAGSWDDHVDGTPGTPSPTAPGSIFRGRLDSQTQQYISDAYLDDACDGVIEVSLDVNGTTLSSFARISSGPPDFAPDSYPVRTVADDLEQMALGPNVTEAVTPEQSGEVIRRALETVRLMNTQAMNGNQNVGGVNNNRNNLAGQDNGRGRAFEPLFEPALTDATTVRAFHAAVLAELSNNTPPTFLDHLRQYDEVGDLSNDSRRKMPGMMRGSDGNHLALTRRQRDKIRAASETPPLTPPPTATTPEQDMSALITHFQSRAVLHTGISTGNNTIPLSNLFADSAALMDYLQNAEAKGPLAGAQLNQQLVVAGNPGASAFFQLISRPDHPMSNPFSREVPNTGRTGLDIIERWILSL